LVGLNAFGGIFLNKKNAFLVIFSLILLFEFSFSAVPVIDSFVIKGGDTHTNSVINPAALNVTWNYCDGKANPQMAFNCQDTVGAWKAFSASTNIDFTEADLPNCNDDEGPKTVYAWVRCDLNDETISLSANDSISLDMSPPTTAFSPNGEITSDDPFTVSISCADNPAAGGAGCNVIAYNIDGTGWNYSSTIPASFPIAGEGLHTVDFYGSDALDQNEIQKTGWIIIDTTAPYSKIDQNDIGQNIQIISFDLNDDLSGIDLSAIVVKINGQQSTVFNAQNHCTEKDDTNSYTCSYQETGLLLQTGTYSIEITEKDKAGNQRTQNADFNYNDEKKPAELLGGPSCTSGGSDIPLTWVASTEADVHQYYVYRSTSQTFNADNNKRVKKVLHSGNCSGGNCNATDSNNLSTGTTYYYKISVVDKSGNESGPSPASSGCSTSAGGTPGTPTISFSTHDEGGWNTSNDPQFTWTTVTGTNINYYYALNGTSDYNPDAGDDHKTGTSQNYTNKNDGKYWFHVRAYNGTTWGSTDHYKIGIDTEEPSEPDDFTLNVQSDGDIKLSWDDSSDDTSGIEYYYIYRSTSSNVDVDDDYLTRVDGDDTSYTDEDVSSGKKYYYVVRARDYAGNYSDETNEKSATASGEEGIEITIDAPRYTKAGEITIKVTSTNGKMYNAYLYLRHPDGDREKLRSGVNSSSFSTDYTFGEDEDGTYEIEVEAEDEDGEVYKPEKLVTVDTAKPSVEWKEPAAGEIVSDKTNLVVEAKDSESGIENVTFYRNSTKISTVKTKSGANEYTEQWDTTSVSDGEHTLKAVATDKAGNSEEATLTVRVKQTADENKKKADDAIALANASKEKSDLLEGQFGEFFDSLPVEFLNLKEAADNALADAQTALEEKNYAAAEESAKLAEEKYKQICETFSVEEYESMEKTFTEEEIRAALSGLKIKKELIDRALENSLGKQPVRKIKVVQVKDGDNPEFLVVVVFSFSSDLNDENVQIVEIVPKSLSYYAAGLVSTAEFTVIKDDPIIVFDVSGMEQGGTLEITYQLKEPITKSKADVLLSRIEQDFAIPPIFFSQDTELSEEDFEEITQEVPAVPAGEAFTPMLLILAAFAIAIIVLVLLYAKKAPPKEKEKPTPLGAAVGKTYVKEKKPGRFSGMLKGKPKEKEGRWAYKGE